MAEFFDPVREAKVLRQLGEDAVVLQKSGSIQALVTELSELQKRPAQLKAVVHEMEKTDLWSRIWVHHSKNACGDVTVLNIDEEIGRARLFREPKKLAFDLTKDLTTDQTTNLGKPVLPSCTISDQKKRHQSLPSITSHDR